MDELWKIDAHVPIEGNHHDYDLALLTSYVKLKVYVRHVFDINSKPDIDAIIITIYSYIHLSHHLGNIILYG